MASGIHPLNDTPVVAALKGLTLGSTLFIAGSMTTTSLQFLPSLVLAAQTRDSSRNRGLESGRLTPVPTPGQEKKELNLTPQAALQGKIDESAKQVGQGYKIAALQFGLMSKTSFATIMPLEAVTVLASGFLAYHYRSIGLSASAWGKWAAVAGLVASVFPLTGIAIAPLDHKLLRMAGEEAQIEPYEDAPPDREMERDNTEKFLKSWNTFNFVRAGLVATAGAVSVWSLLE
ncbi:hypothetical protein KC333_g3522 [Hortaea werneckii]|nr:hypothetical protein KC334_g19122 [Hortaea werneckii]KAI6893618.1 hypothetical protein KC355_g20773 [Hortaea werneckii]KAI7196900.1 hypothetical protein KC324_g4327 [Hortaea werneckii]KAI7218575.1 hypothetical protein KC333_g3522 [Hortaea werneckii]KAI7305934.1 hypothetical protein KC315_g14447 [Hortaea werneckii]